MSQDAAMGDGSPSAVRAEEQVLSVLVVDDHALQQQWVRVMLEALGWRVTQAHDGLEALAAVKGSNFDLILMDRHMPRCGGDFATLAIRAMPGRSETVIICCSTDPPTGRAAELYDGMLPKPFTVSSVSDMLHEIRSFRQFARSLENLAEAAGLRGGSSAARRLQG